jgi:hypothetical protein
MPGVLPFPIATPEQALHRIDTLSGNQLHLVCSRCQLPLVVPVHFLGQVVTCSRCGLPLTVVSTPQPPAVPSTSPPRAFIAAPPLPPPVPLPPPPPPANPTTAEAEEEAWEEEPPQPRNGLVFGCLLALLFLGILGGVVGAVVIGVLLFRSEPSTSDIATTPPAQEIAPANDLPPERLQANDSFWWTDASARALTFSGISVRIDRVAFSNPRFQSRDEILSTNEDYLLVSLTVTNQSKRDVTYKSWYSYRFEDEAGQGALAAELIDDQDRRFELFPIPGADRVEKHIHSEYYIAQDDAISDTLVFKLPANYPRDSKRSLKLSLPAAAFELNDVYRFKIPAYMITESIAPLSIQPSSNGSPANP